MSAGLPKNNKTDIPLYLSNGSLNASCLLINAETLLQANEIGLAKGLFVLSLKTETHTHRAFFGLARCFEAENKFDKAAMHYREALKIQADPDIHKAFLKMLEKQSNDKTLRSEKLLEICNEALSLSPLEPWAVLKMIQSAYQTKNFAPALKHIERIAQAHPDNIDVLYTLAGLQFQMKMKEAALKTLEQIYLINPTHTGARDLVSKVVNL